MATKKNQNPLAANIPDKSTLNDVDRVTPVACEDWVETWDARKAQKDKDTGLKKVKRDPDKKLAWCNKETGIDRDGNAYTIPQHYEFPLVEVGTGKKYVYWLYTDAQITDTIEDSEHLQKQKRLFTYNVDRCSKGDLQSKIGGYKLKDLTFRSVCKYWAKYPIEVLYDYTWYEDKDTGETKQSSEPKIQLWWKTVNEDTPRRNLVELDF